MNSLSWVIAIIVVIALYVVALYNSLVKRKNRVNEAWADIEVQLKRRHNLIPNVVETVKGYAKHEKGVFEKVTKARADAASAKSPKAQGDAENMLSATLKTLFAVAENYPDLKANVNFLELQRELSDTEDKIQAARRFYNSNVRDFNTAIESVPTNIVAGIFGFKQRDMFEISDEAVRSVPQVSFEA
ncbi:MAG: LemA-like protein [Parcubacteria group bacterium GW2011_GWA2_47_8]|nr:MAG: LemA-like protein [Parcubacteria group bacterium GW2011_GWA2_47_8]OHB18440.1 MAG: hypothetical protein A2666_05135 [Parcubacteria group bacterium RIFCSPHIGHO2_01_FULL_47_10b]